MYLKDYRELQFMQASDIKAMRDKMGITQEALARLLGVSFQTINRWERGVFKPSPLALEKIKAIAKEGMSK